MLLWEFICTPTLSIQEYRTLRKTGNENSSRKIQKSGVSGRCRKWKNRSTAQKEITKKRHQHSKNLKLSRAINSKIAGKIFDSSSLASSWLWIKTSKRTAVAKSQTQLEINLRFQVQARVQFLLLTSTSKMRWKNSLELTNRVLLPRNMLQISITPTATTLSLNLYRL